MLKSRLFALAAVLCFVWLFAGVRVLAETAADQDIAASTAIQSDSAAAIEDSMTVSESEPPPDDFDFFADTPVQSAAVVELPPEKSRWITIGAPLGLMAFFFFIILLNWWTVPFTSHSVDINLRDFPPAAKRGIAFAVVIFGIAFCFGASEIWYQLRIHGTAEAYFAQMSLGKLIAFTHAHLFGFTTCFFIIGIPFSMQFNHISLYQWIFPAGLAASVTDVMSWWGIKYLTPNFEWVSIFCGIVFSVSYLWMLIGLLRVLLFPDVIWASDKDRAPRLAAKADAREQRQHHEGDY